MELHSGWDRRKLAIGRVRFMYVKVNIGLGLGRAGPGKFKIIRPVQISHTSL
jgi:hypothetical protein